MKPILVELQRLLEIVPLDLHTKVERVHKVLIGLGVIVVDLDNIMRGLSIDKVVWLILPINHVFIARTLQSLQESVVHVDVLIQFLSGSSGW